ncbi:MAG: flagellar assembly protein FliH [Cellvibrionaceae bacterium]
MTSEYVTRFSEEELGQCQNWSLPDVSSNKLVPSAEKEATDRKNKKGNDQAIEPVNEAAGESIEVSTEDVKPLTAEQLQAITDTAEKDGYDNGYKKGFDEGKKAGDAVGKDEGLKSAQAIVSQQCENLQHIVEALMIPLQTEQKQLQSLMLDMVCQLAKAVVKRELSTDSTQILDVINAALNTIPANAEKFTLHLNEQDLSLVKEHIQSQPKNMDKDFTYHVDESLLPGGCRLETKQTMVDCSIEKRLEEIIDGFLHKQFPKSEESVNVEENSLASKSEGVGDTSTASEKSQKNQPPLSDEGKVE